MKKQALSLKSPLFAALFGAAGVFFAPAMVGLAAPACAASTAALLPDFADLVEKTGSAVVNIRTTEKSKIAQGVPAQNEEEMQEFFRRFFGAPPQRQPQPSPAPRGRRQAPQQPNQDEDVPRGVGSGFIISADGYLLTNAHVVDGADDVYVKLTDKREFKAKVIGSDKRSDVALLKIDGSNLPRLIIGDSNKIRVGEWVIAIGSPYDLDNTVTAGIISAKARETGDYLPLIQTDVAVNPGNSGGPLINLRGEVIGINSQIYSRSGGYQGISFAVPIDEAIRVSDQLKASGKVTRGRIGLQIGVVSKDLAESLGLSKPQGALISLVEAGGPAEKSGLQAGDIILKFNGASIEMPSDLQRAVGATKPDSRSTVTVWRKGASRDIAIKIAEVESDKSAKVEKKLKPELTPNLLGLVVSDLSDAQKQELKLVNGVVIDVADGAAARYGLRQGDVILQLNNSDVKNAKQFNALVAKLDTKRLVALLVRRGEQSQFVTIRPSAQP
jgi:serine protease Do